MRMLIADWICYLDKRVTNLEGKTCSGALLYGDGAPPQSLGINGDLYLRFNGGFLYKKQNNIWTSQGKIQIDLVDGGEIL